MFFGHRRHHPLAIERLHHNSGPWRKTRHQSHINPARNKFSVNVMIGELVDNESHVWMIPAPAREHAAQGLPERRRTNAQPKLSGCSACRPLGSVRDGLETGQHSLVLTLRVRVDGVTPSLSAAALKLP